jgi:acylphosphatase
MRLARRYLISGRVQGVGFRHFARTVAVSEGVNGWVRNLPDGGVEVLAEGELEVLERFEWRIRQGPPHARVDTVEIVEVASSSHDTGFRVR